jgi:hypothetical protein
LCGIEKISVLKYFIDQSGAAKPFILAECLPFTSVHVRIDFRISSEYLTGTGKDQYVEYL